MPLFFGLIPTIIVLNDMVEYEYRILDSVPLCSGFCDSKNDQLATSDAN